MKKIPSYLGFVIGCLLMMGCCSSASALPRELWSKPIGTVSDPAWVMQVFADGTGGAAAIIANGNVPKPEGGYDRLRYTLVWFNVAGRELWRKVFEVPADDGHSSILHVVAANRYAVVAQFFYQIEAQAPVFETSVISRAGAETDVDEVSTVEGLTGGIEKKNVYSDATGFFGFRIDAENNVSLVRHTFR